MVESRIVVIDHLPALLASETLIQQSQHLRHVELDVFEVEIVLVILLHLQQIIQLEIQLKQASVTTCLRLVSSCLIVFKTTYPCNARR